MPGAYLLHTLAGSRQVPRLPECQLLVQSAGRRVLSASLWEEGGGARQNRGDRRWPLVATRRIHARENTGAILMSSPVRPLRNPAQFGVAFWLPPGGTDNGVFAAYWAELADLESTDVGTVLTLLADAGVGGYVATPGGALGHRARSPIHRLWVDSLRYHRAEDILMAYLNRRDRKSQSHSATTS